MGKIKWTREAVDWLRKVHQFIAKDKPVAAKNLIANIRRRTKILSNFPEIGHLLEDYPDENIKILLYGHYRIVYRIKTDKNIDIVGVFHGAIGDIKKYIR